MKKTGKAPSGGSAKPGKTSGTGEDREERKRRRKEEKRNGN